MIAEYQSVLQSSLLFKAFSLKKESITAQAGMADNAEGIALGLLV